MRAAALLGLFLAGGAQAASSKGADGRASARPAQKRKELEPLRFAEIGWQVMHPIGFTISARETSAGTTYVEWTRTVRIGLKGGRTSDFVLYIRLQYGHRQPLHEGRPPCQKGRLLGSISEGSHFGRPTRSWRCVEPASDKYELKLKDGRWILLDYEASGPDSARASCLETFQRFKTSLSPIMGVEKAPKGEKAVPLTR